jgi:hypothetical protein
MRNNVSKPLDRACVGRILPERNMRSRPGEGLTLNEATKMADDDMGKAVVDAFKSALFSSAPMVGFFSTADSAKRTIIRFPWPASVRQS